MTLVPTPSPTPPMPPLNPPAQPPGPPPLIAPGLPGAVPVQEPPAPPADVPPTSPEVPPQVNLRTPAPPHEGAGAEHAAPLLPHERDQSVEMTRGEPHPEMEQALRDLQRGLQDTDRGPPADRAYRQLKD